MDRVFDHPEFRDHIDAYLVGALAADERAAFESHAAACTTCAAALAEAAAQDASLRELFAGAAPRAGFEDRLVERLRWAARPNATMLLHPMVRRAATGVAAAVLLAGFGYVATQSIQNNGGLPVPWATASPHHFSQATTQPFQNRSQSIVQGLLGGMQTPRNMADDWVRSVDADADTNRWMYKSRQMGEQGRWDTTLSQAAPPMSGKPAASAPPAASEPQGQVGRELVETLNKESKSTKGTADVSGGKDQPAKAPDASFDRYRGYGMAGGGGFGGGGGKPGGFGAAAPAPGGGGVGAGGPGVGTGGKAAVDAAPSSTAGITNGRAPDANGDGAVPGVPAGAPNAALGLEYREGRSSGVDTRKPQPAANDHAFRPNAFFEAPPADKLDVAAGDTFAKHGEVVAALRDVDSAKPQDVKAEELKQRVATLGDAPAATQPVQAPPAADPGQPAATNPTAGRKIIRNGDMTFEVDGFDSAYVQITKIVQEEGGFVATTDSEKLANGKVKGTVTVRVPPERLDTLVLKLRGLGDLKSSKLAAQDITKQYTDLESQLKAARAMEERLLNVIKTGKGTIKELVEAEKQLGVYREKIEQIEGEVRYYNNLVSLSTLNITLIERDIRTAAMLSETEQVNMGVESQDVEKARASAIKAIEEAKGRIVESDLKKLEAGQFAAKVVADVPPDAAGPLIDRMKQIGTVARLEVSRRQSAPEGTVAPTPAQGGAAVRLERRDTRFLISLYNLANVAPRQTTNLNLAAEDVEAAYRTILDQVKGAGGRVVTSQLNRPRPDQTTGTITFEAPAEAADVLLGAVRATGEVTRLDVTQNPDAQNVTEAKRGFAVQVFSIASVAPRETTTLRLAARGVADAFNKLREAMRSAQGARILSSQLAEQDPANVTGTLDFEVRRADWAAVEAALREAGQVVSRNVTRSADTENTVDTKVRLQVVLADEAALQPRETVAVQLAVSDVPARYAKLLEAAGAAQARVLQSQLSEDQAQKNVTGTLAFDVRRENRPAMEAALNEAGDVVSRTVVRSTDTLNTLDDKVRLSLTLTDAAKLPPRETTTLGMESPDVEKAKEQVESLALGMGGRVVDSTLSREQDGRVIAKVVADVPLAKSLEMVRKTRDQGRVQFRRDAREEGVPQGSLARARVDVTIANEDLIVQNDKGLGSTIREGLRTSVTGLLWSLQLIVVGLLLVAPWALIVYVAWRLFRRARTRRQPPAAAPAT